MKPIPPLKLEPGDVVRTPSQREALVRGPSPDDRWQLVYTDDRTEVVLKGKLLTLVRRAGEQPPPLKSLEDWMARGGYAGRNT